MVKRDFRSPNEIELELEKFSMLGHLDDIVSFNNEIAHSGNSREILLFRYPEKKAAKL